MPTNKYTRRPSASIPNGDDNADVIRIKVTAMGDGNTGKSCLIKRYCEEKFVSRYISTIGVDFGVKPVELNGLEIKVNFWDLSGHPEFFEVRNEFYKDTQGALLVFDLSCRSSFESLESWLVEAKRFGCSNSKETRADLPQSKATIYLVGNKSDKRKRTVTETEARRFASFHNLKYYETSANTGENVNQMFEDLYDDVLHSIGRLHRQET